MRHFFHAEQWLPYPVEIVFAFFSDPQNLPRLMPAWQKARIDSATLVPPMPLRTGIPMDPETARAGAGSRMTITFRPLPLSPLRASWDAEITSFAWNDHFCDTQLRGPFAYWHHCHRVKPETRSKLCGTLLRDEVEYALSFGLPGTLGDRLPMQPLFRSMFSYRQQRTAELLQHAEASRQQQRHASRER